VELTWRRWLAIVLAATLLIGFAFRPAPQVAAVFAANPSMKYNVSKSRLTYRSRVIEHQILERRFADSVLLAMKKAGSSREPLFDSRVPKIVREEVMAPATRLLKEAASAKTPLALAVTVGDRPDITRIGNNVLYILPDRVNGGPCTVVLRIPLRHAERLSSAQFDSTVTTSFKRYFEGFPTQQDTGPCGFFMAFGTPSPQIAKTLREQGWIAASAGYAPGSPPPRAMWGVTPFFNRYFSNQERADGIVACAAGRLDVCEAGVFSPAPSFGGPSAPPSDFVGAARLEPLRGNSAMRAHLLDDMARALGPEKFAQLWHSPTDIPTAYAAVAGEPFDMYLQRWLQGAIGRTYVGPQLTARFALIAVSAVVIGLAIAVATQTSRRIS
jgi:hypothetical protein